MPTQDSGASLAQRHLGAESRLVGHSFQQEFLSELETGAELLQSHAQLLVGNALSHQVWRRMEDTPPLEWQARPRHDDGLKVHLLVLLLVVSLVMYLFNVFTVLLQCIYDLK